MILIDKPVGETMGQLVDRIRAEQQLGDISITYAGRLDPAASGLVILLTGDEVHQKEDFLGLDKTYEVQVLFGVATDTYDLLGKPSKSDFDGLPLMSDVRGKLRSLVGQQQQPYPPYSSRPVQGKPLWQWSREGRLDEIEIPTKTIEVYSAELLNQDQITSERLLARVQDLLEKISGDFRQIEINDAWQSLLSKNLGAVWPTATLRIAASSGTYIRTLAMQLGQQLGLPALAMHIRRTQLGEYTLEDVK